MLHRTFHPLGSALLGLAVTLTAACSADDPGLPTGDTPTDLVLPVFSHGASHAGGHLGTHMNSAQNTPTNDSRAQSQLVLRLDASGTTLSYKLLVANIEDVTQSHIHLGAPGVNGPPLVWLYPAAPPAQLIPGRFDGVLAQGVITDADVVGPLAGQGVAGLLATIQAGNAYANVHTSEFPPGEIRGQVD